ncbi:MAG: ABC transporter ATP-binding protein [Phycisphaerae bacterium]|nr:ABC transporter ATP-binding protein [Phycisphaerae bacterium]
MNENNIILKAENIHKSYKIGASKLKVLKGVDLELKKGEFAAVTGASGSGKSTLLHILGTLDKPDDGTVIFNGQQLFASSDKYLNNFRNKKVGFVFQFYHLLDELNVLENIYLPVMASKSIFGWFAVKKQARNKALELLSMFGLEDRAKHKPYQLSGGERQRVAIARALINDPPLLLADEPTGNLDSQTGNGIMDVLEKLNTQANQTILLVTHDKNIAKRAERVIKLKNGKIDNTKG